MLVDAAVLGQDMTSIALYWSVSHALSRLLVSNRVGYLTHSLNFDVARKLPCAVCWLVY